MRLRKGRPERTGAVEIPDRVHRFGRKLLVMLGDRSRVLLLRGFLAVSRAHEPCGACERPNAVVGLQRRRYTNHRRIVRRG